MKENGKIDTRSKSKKTADKSKKTAKSGKVIKGTFLTVEDAFDNAIEKLKTTTPESERGKLYVWSQRFKEGSLSYKKIASILEDAGMKRVVKEQWTVKVSKKVEPKKQPLEAFTE